MAKKCQYYNHTMAQEGSIKQEYYFKKSLGIILASQTELKLNQSIISIIKKGWHYAYVYIQQHNLINISIFMDKYIKKNKGIDNLTDDNINSIILVIILLSDYFDKNLDKEDPIFKDYILNIQRRMLHYKFLNRINIEKISLNKKKQLKNLEMKIKNEKKILYAPSGYRFDNQQLDGMEVLVDKMSKNDKFFSCFEYIFDLENLSLITIVGDDYLKSKDIQELIYCYTQFIREDKEEIVDYEELKRFLYPAIQIRYLCKEYKKSKEYFFDNFNEELYNEINKVQNENNTIKKSNLLLQDENEKLKLEIERIQKENKKLQFELDKKNDESTEVVSLRDFIFSLNTKDDIKVNDTIDINNLKDIKAIFIGGSPTLQNKLKTIFTAWEFINTDNMNFAPELLLNSDNILIYTNYLSHALYYKVINIVNKNKLKVIYLNANTNIDRLLKDIFTNVVKK